MEYTQLQLIIRLVGVIPCAIQCALLLMCFISSSLCLLIPYTYFALPPLSLLGFPSVSLFLFCICLKQATVLACSPSSLSAAVGTEDGRVHFLDVRDVESPHEVHKAFLSESPVQHLL